MASDPAKSSEGYWSRNRSEKGAEASSSCQSTALLSFAAGRSDEIGVMGEVREKAVSDPGKGIDPSATPGFVESCVPSKTVEERAGRREKAARFSDGSEERDKVGARAKEELFAESNTGVGVDWPKSLPRAGPCAGGSG